VENVKFLGLAELDRLIDGLNAADKEELAKRLLAKLDPEARSRAVGLGGLTVVTGSFVSLNSDVAVNIQNSNSSFDPEAIVKALLEYRNLKKEN
jgi:hypothetical protein